MGPLFKSDELPTYHDGMLFVRMKPRAPAADLLQGAGVAAAAAFVPNGGGMQALAFYERAGLVKRVTPVARDKPQYVGRMLAIGGQGTKGFKGITAAGEHSLSALALGMSAPVDIGSTATATSLVELSGDADIKQLQMALAADPDVASVARVPLRYLAAKVPAGSDSRGGAGGATIAAAPPAANTMWNLRKVRWAEARAAGGFKDATTIKVAVLDTGIDRDHPDLAGRIGGYVYNHPDLPGASSAHDVIGHGTHVSGTIGALINNALGINGICECSIHAWKIFDDQPDIATYSNGTAQYVYYVDPVMYLRALIDCADEGVDVVNLSIGGGGAPDSSESEAFATLIANGTIVCAAMGNEGEQGSPTSYPAAIPGVIAVGATNLQDRVTSFSNRGNHIAVCAPGDAIWSTLPTYAGQFSFEAVRGADGRWKQGRPNKREMDYDAWPGTSMATPHVAAAMALYLANGGDRSPGAPRKALAATAAKVAAMQGNDFTPAYGYGRLDLEALIAAI
jgi:subtilisin family serine protease